MRQTDTAGSSWSCEARSSHQGGEATRSFFPLTALDESTVAAADAALADPGLDLTVRRALVDSTDEVRRRIRARATTAS